MVCVDVSAMCSRGCSLPKGRRLHASGRCALRRLIAEREAQLIPVAAACPPPVRAIYSSSGDECGVQRQRVCRNREGARLLIPVLQRLDKQLSGDA
jgi:hypothetical protein